LARLSEASRTQDNDLNFSLRTLPAEFPKAVCQFWCCELKGSLQSARHTKTDVDVTVVGLIVVANRGTAVVCLIVPGTATQHAALMIVTLSEGNVSKKRLQPN